MNQEVNGEVKAVNQAEWFKVRFLDKVEIDLIYVLIGSIQEYFGSYTKHKEIVDHYFPNELKKAEIIKCVCEKILMREKLYNDVTLVIQDSQHSYLKSKNICRVLNIYYRRKIIDHSTPKSFLLSRNDNLFNTDFKPELVFNPLQFSFLIGAFIRNQASESSITFANANHKAKMTISFIQNFSAFTSKNFSVKYGFGTPFTTNISLENTNIFWQVLEDFTKKICS